MVGRSRWWVRTGIEGRSGLLELPRVAQHGKEFATLHELEHLSKKASTQDAGEPRRKDPRLRVRAGWECGRSTMCTACSSWKLAASPRRKGCAHLRRCVTEV